MSARARAAETTEDRVRAIRDLMLADDWRADLARVLAGFWNVSVGWVQKLSAEASRRVRDKDNRPLLRARYIDTLEKAVEVAELELTTERGSPAKASEAITKAVLASAQISGVSIADDPAPRLVINVGQPTRSDVIGDLWGEPVRKTIEAHGEPVPSRAEVHPRELPARVDEGAAVLDDAER